MKGYRKLIAFLFVVVVSIVFVILKHINGNNFVAIIGIVFPSYVAGNYAEHYTESKNEMD